MPTVRGRQFADAQNEGRENQASHQPVANVFGPGNKWSEFLGTKMHFDAVVELLQHAIQPFRNVCTKGGSVQAQLLEQSSSFCGLLCSRASRPGVGFEHFAEVEARVEAHPVAFGHGDHFRQQGNSAE